MQTNQNLEEYDLASEINELFQNANSTRFSRGVTNSLQNACVREMVESGDNDWGILQMSEDCDCQQEESCDNCEKPLVDVCSMEEVFNRMKEHSPFNNIANLLTTTKKYEFIALAENAYAEIGNKPFKFISNRNYEISEEQQDEVGTFLVQYIQNFIDLNEVKVSELSEAFNFDTIGEITTTLANEVQEQFESKIRNTIERNEEVVERVFERTDFMREYLEVIRDVTEYPLGVLWLEDDTVVQSREVKGGKLKFSNKIHSTARRVDPCYFWATSDWKLHRAGRGVFRLQQFSAGDIKRWVELDVSGSKKISKNAEEFLEDNPDQYRMLEAMLFEDHYLLKQGVYDVMIFRGKVTRESIEQYDIPIPNRFNGDKYIPIECYYADNVILRAKVLEYADENLGVFTTIFRRNGDSIWGYSLHEFLYPFAKMYQGALKVLDKSTGRSVVKIVQIDTGVIEDTDKYMTKNEATGELELNIDQDVLLEFDSSQAFTSPNFKGVPLHVTNFTSEMGEIIPVMDVIFREMERVSGIPTMLVNGGNISSALRTTSNFNSAFNASGKIVKSLLREHERRVLKPAIRYIFDVLAGNGEMKDFLIEAEPQILLSDTLVRQMNDDRVLLEGVQVISQFGEMIPAEKMAKLINSLGRKVYNLDEDLIPNVGVMNTNINPEPEQEM